MDQRGPGRVWRGRLATLIESSILGCSYLAVMHWGTIWAAGRQWSLWMVLVLITSGAAAKAVLDAIQPRVLRPILRRVHLLDALPVPELVTF